MTDHSALENYSIWKNSNYFHQKIYNFLRSSFRKFWCVEYFWNLRRRFWNFDAPNIFETYVDDFESLHNVQLYFAYNQ